MKTAANVSSSPIPDTILEICLVKSKCTGNCQTNVSLSYLSLFSIYLILSRTIDVCVYVKNCFFIIRPLLINLQGN